MSGGTGKRCINIEQTVKQYTADTAICVLLCFYLHGKFGIGGIGGKLILDTVENFVCQGRKSGVPLQGNVLYAVSASHTHLQEMPVQPLLES